MWSMVKRRYRKEAQLDIRRNRDESEFIATVKEITQDVADRYQNSFLREPYAHIIRYLKKAQELEAELESEMDE